jgi:mRNA interferase RelE/StbE
MDYKLHYSRKSEKQLSKIDKQQAKLILFWMEKNVNNCKNPKEVVSYKELKGNLEGFFRYRIGSYRVICEMDKDELVVIAISIAHRKEIYK